MPQKGEKKGSSIYKERLDAVYDELKWLYMELYDNEEEFRSFLGMMQRAFNGRRGELKELDAEREKDKNWYKSRKMLGMILYVDCFADTLKGFHDHLDYIEECGVNLVHLMPLLKSPKEKSDGGYAVSDFRKVEPELGTMKELADIASECHKRKIRLCLDFVMNHTSEEHIWAMKAKQGIKEYQDMYFFYDDREIPDQFEQTMPQVFPTTAPGNFTWCEEAKKTVMTTFYPFQWDLNYLNPAVLREMTANLLNLCNQGIDVIRLDAIPYIWKTLHTNCRNLKQVHTILRILRMTVGVVCPGTLLLGEVVMAPAEVVPYFGTVEKPECNMLYNVTTMCTTWHTVATRDVRLLRNQLDIVFSLPKEYVFLNYLRCHDDIGWGLDYACLSRFGQDEIPHKKFLNNYFLGYCELSESRGELYNDDPVLKDARLCGTTASLIGIEKAEYEHRSEKLDRAIRCHIMLHAFLLVQRGLPILYGGDEIGQLNDYTYHEDPVKKEDSRYLHRGKRSWEETALRKKKGTRQERIFSGLKKLEEIRKTHPVFSFEADCRTINTGNDHVLGIRRSCQGSTLLAFFNFGDADAEIYVPEVTEVTEGQMSDLLREKPVEGEKIRIRGGDFVWLG